MTILDIVLFMMGTENFSTHIVLKSGHPHYTTAAVMFFISRDMIWEGEYYG